jgi:hypothetical protein
MKVNYLQEPYLIFGKAKSICPREGIAQLDVYDTVESARKNQLLIGIVGIEEDIESFKNWLKRCEKFIPVSPTGKQKGLFKSFPGINLNSGFCAVFMYDTIYERTLSPNDIKTILQENHTEQRILRAVDLFAENVKFLSDI